METVHTYKMALQGRAQLSGRRIESEDPTSYNNL
jgi:hypothetical protein